MDGWMAKVVILIIIIITVFVWHLQEEKTRLKYLHQYFFVLWKSNNQITLVIHAYSTKKREKVTTNSIDKINK
jgi:hypothetical protein